MLSTIFLSKIWCEPHETSNLNLQIPEEGFAYSYLNLSVIQKQSNYSALKRLTKIWRVLFGIELIDHRMQIQVSEKTILKILFQIGKLSIKD